MPKLSEPIVTPPLRSRTKFPAESRWIEPASESPKKLIFALEVQLEAWIDRARAKCLAMARGVDRHQRRYVERQADALAEIRIQRHLYPGHQPLVVDPEATVGQGEAAERADGQLAVDDQADTRVAAGKFEAELHRALDRDQAGDRQLPGHLQLEAADNVELSVLDDQVSG